MQPTILLATANIPNNGGQLQLSQRGNDFVIGLKGESGELMTSRMYSSEQALAELGCAHLKGIEHARVLVGGMGMGYTLAAVLKATLRSAEVVVAELVPEIIAWNKGSLGECAGRPLEDGRVRVQLGDVQALFKNKQPVYDAVLLDVDNGPDAFTHDDNSNLYSLDSLRHEPSFTKRLQKVQFNQVRIETVKAHKGKGSQHTIYLAQK